MGATSSICGSAARGRLTGPRFSRSSILFPSSDSDWVVERELTGKTVTCYDHVYHAVSAGMCPLSGLTSVVNDAAFVGPECTCQAEEASRCAHGTISVRAQVNNYYKASISNTALAVERHTGVLGSGNEQRARKSRAQRRQAGQQARLQSATRTSSTQVCRLITAHDKDIVTRHYRLPVKNSKGRMRNRTGDNGAWAAE